jgi:hypothetical protein
LLYELFVVRATVTSQERVKFLLKLLDVHRNVGTARERKIILSIHPSVTKRKTRDYRRPSVVIIMIYLPVYVIIIGVA